MAARLQYLEAKALDDVSYNSGDNRLVDARSIIYIVRSSVDNAQMIAQQIKTRPR